MDRLLITNTHVVSLDPAVGTLPRADVLVVDGRIAVIGPDLDVTDADRIDGTGTIAIPGFVDTHRHTWQSVIRGTLAAGTLGDYFGAVILGVGPAFQADDVYAGNIIGTYEALNSGVTTIVDWCNVTNTPEHADAAIGALQEAGIRAMYGYGTSGGLDWIINSTLPHSPDARRVKEKYFSSDDQLLTLALALRGAVGGLSRELNSHDFAYARDLDARITVHLAARMNGGTMGQVGDLVDDGLLGPDVTIVHANEASDEELDRMADAGTSVSVAPYVEMVMGHGVPPTNRCLAHGIRPSLSMDVACAVPGDMFTQMRFAYAQSRAGQLPADLTAPFVPERVPEDVLRFATIDGAAACGLDDRIGTLTVGKDADIVLVRSDAINTIPDDDPYSTVVVSADTSNVDTVLVRGRVVKRAGTLVGVDLDRLRRLGTESRERLLRAGAAAPQHGQG